MKKIYFILITITVLMPLNVYAVDWQSKNCTLVEVRESAGRTEAVIKDESGRLFGVSYVKDIDGNKLDKIINLEKDFYKWSFMTIKSIKFVVYSETVQIVIMPEKFVYDNVDIMSYAASGLLFVFSDALRYDFRVVCNDIFLKIKGQFSDEESLCKKVVSAIRDPHAYLRSRDPEYLLSRVERLEEALSAMQNHVEALKRENEIMRYAATILHNKGFFGGLNMIEKDALQKVIDIKKASPQMKNAEVYDAVQKQNIDLSRKEVNLILGVYFNEFE